MKPFKTSLRVRYSETDQMRVAYYGSYFVWLETARTELFRKIGLEYTRMEKEGFFMMVVEASCQYKAPCEYDDLISIDTKIFEIKNYSLSFDYKLYKNNKLIATAQTAHVFCNKKGRPVKIPPKVKNAINQT